MTFDDQIKDEKVQSKLIEIIQEYQPFHQAQVISVYVTRKKKYHPLIKYK